MKRQIELVRYGVKKLSVLILLISLQHVNSSTIYEEETRALDNAQSRANDVNGELLLYR
jgi:hypothetical protein